MADVIVFWGENEWYCGKTTTPFQKGKPVKVNIPFLGLTETFQPDEHDSVKPAPFYLDGHFTTRDAKKIVVAARMLKLIKSTLKNSLKEGDYHIIKLTDGIILSRGDNHLEKSKRFARLECRWDLNQGISIVAQIVDRVARPEQWGKIVWTERYKDTNPNKEKILELVNNFIMEQRK